MPFCNQCGNALSAQDLYCQRCGSRQPQTPPVPPAGSDPLSGISPRTASILCYVPGLGWIAAIVVLASLRFRGNRGVRFHAFQGLYLFVAWMLNSWVLRPFEFMESFMYRVHLHSLVELILLGLEIFMMIKAAHDQTYSLPLFGELAERSLTDQQPNGTISAPFTANLLGGAYNVTPTCTGVNSPPSFSLTNNALNVSGSVSVAETGFTRNHVTGLWTSTMTVTNTSGAAITGPVQVLITNLTAGDSMANASGTHGGVAFITVTTGALAAGAQVNLMIEFNNPSNESIDFTPVPYAGGLTTP